MASVLELSLVEGNRVCSWLLSIQSHLFLENDLNGVFYVSVCPRALTLYSILGCQALTLISQVLLSETLCLALESTIEKK